MNPNISAIPAIVFGVIVGVLLLLMLLVNPRNARPAIGCMFFLASISMITDWDKRIYPTFMLPLQAYRAQLFGAIGVVLAIGLFARGRSIPWRDVSGQAWLLLVMGVYGGMLRMIHVSPEDGFASMLMAVATVLPLAIVLPLQFVSEQDCVRVIKLLVWVAVLWSVGSLAQYVMDPRLAVLGPRHHFTGMIANPNLAATMLNVVTLCSLWLSLNGPARHRLVYLFMTVTFGVLLAWTGSRGGMLSLFVGAAAIAYSRLGSVALFLPVIAGGLFAVLKAADAAGVSLDVDKLLSLKNSRAGLAAGLIANFLENPLIGVGPERIKNTENSYLLALGQFGAGMFLLVVAMLGVSAIQALKLWRLRTRVSRQYAALIDLCIAQQVMYFFNALFEGIIGGRVGPNMVVILIVSAMGRFILENALVDPGAAQSSEEELDWHSHVDDHQTTSQPA